MFDIFQSLIDIAKGGWTQYREPPSGSRTPIPTLTSSNRVTPRDVDNCSRKIHYDMKDKAESVVGRSKKQDPERHATLHAYQCPHCLNQGKSNYILGHDKFAAKSFVFVVPYDDFEFALTKAVLFFKSGDYAITANNQTNIENPTIKPADISTPTVKPVKPPLPKDNSSSSLAPLPTIDKVKSSMTNESHLGSGGNNHVFGVDKNYVLRVPRPGFSQKSRNGFKVKSSYELVGDEIKPITDPFPGRNFGHAIATVGDDGATLNRRVEGFAGGVSSKGGSPSSDENDKIYKDHLARTAAMPQQAYHDMLGDIYYLKNKGYQIDGSKSSNVMIDPKAGRFTHIDIDKSKYPDRPINPYSATGGMNSLLLNNQYAYKYKDPNRDYWNEDDGGTNMMSRQDDLIPHRRRILQKIYNAAKHHGAEFNPEDINNPTSSYGYSLKLARANHDDLVNGKYND